MSSGISAKAKWNVNEASINRIVNRYIKKNLTTLENVVDWYAAESAEYIEKFKILSGSSTGTNWHRNKNAERGFNDGARVDSGAMAASVGYESYSFNSEHVVGAEFGLPTPFGGGEQYFMSQEEGFDIKLRDGSKHTVKPMNSAGVTRDKMRGKMRRKMLSEGFLTGKQDVRGSTVIALMGGSAGKSYSFEAAWAMTGDDQSPARRAASKAYLDNINKRELERFIRQQKASNNRNVIESSRESSAAGFSAFVNFKTQAATRDEAGF